MNSNKPFEEIMNEFIDNTDVSGFDDGYYEIEKQFFNMFGHGVPREMLPDSITMEQIKEAMQRCIAAHSGDLFKELGIEIHEDYLY